MTTRGNFIAIEGLDGSGKTTLAKNLVQLMNENGTNAEYIKAPDHTEYGKAIYEALKEHPISKQAQMFAMLSALTHLYQTTIKPKLEEGITIICDRFLASTLAYNVDTTDSESIQLIKQLEQTILEQPHYVWIWNTPSQSACRILERANNTPEQINLFETGNNEATYNNILHQMKTIHEGYLVAMLKCRLGLSQTVYYPPQEGFPVPREVYRKIDQLC